MDIFLESLWGQEQENEPETIAEVAKRNRALLGPNAMSLNMWERASLLDALDSGINPLAHEASVATKAVANGLSSKLLNTKVTLTALLARAGNDELTRIAVSMSSWRRNFKSTRSQRRSGRFAQPPQD